MSVIINIDGPQIADVAFADNRQDQTIPIDTLIVYKHDGGGQAQEVIQLNMSNIINYFPLQSNFFTTIESSVVSLDFGAVHSQIWTGGYALSDGDTVAFGLAINGGSTVEGIESQQVSGLPQPSFNFGGDITAMWSTGQMTLMDSGGVYATRQEVIDYLDADPSNDAISFSVTSGQTTFNILISRAMIVAASGSSGGGGEFLNSDGDVGDITGSAGGGMAANFALVPSSQGQQQGPQQGDGSPSGPLADQHRHFLQSSDGTPVLASVMDMGEYLRAREETIQDIFGNHLVTDPSDLMGDFTAGTSGNFSLTNGTSVNALLGELGIELAGSSDESFESNWKTAVSSLQELKDVVLQDMLQWKAGQIQESGHEGFENDINSLEASFGQTFDDTESPFRDNGPAHGDAYLYDGDIYVLIIDSTGGQAPNSAKVVYPGEVGGYDPAPELITEVDTNNTSEWSSLEHADFLNGTVYFRKFNNHLELREELYGEANEWRTLLGDGSNLVTAAAGTDGAPVQDYFGDDTYVPGSSDLDAALGLEYTDKASDAIPSDSTIGGSTFAWTPESPTDDGGLAHKTAKEMFQYHIDKDVAKDASITTLAGYISNVHDALGTGGQTGTSGDPAQGFADTCDMTVYAHQIILGNGTSSLPESFVDMAQAIEAAIESGYGSALIENGQVGLGITLHGDDSGNPSVQRAMLGIGWDQSTLESGLPIENIVFEKGLGDGSPSAQVINDGKTLKVTTKTNSTADGIKSAIDSLSISGLTTMLHIDGAMTDASVGTSSSTGRLPMTTPVDLVRVFDAVSDMSKVEWGLYLQMTPEQYDTDPGFRMISINGLFAAYWDDSNSEYVQASERKLRPLDIMTYEASRS